jgi:signal transduction histidine kinase
VSLAQEGEDIIFKVVDNGIGVPEAQQKKLFKKFFRAANAQNTRPDGTGLGLYLVKRVVEDEGGEVIFKSNEGRGSTFGFRMPVHNKIKPNSKAAQKLASGDTLSSAPSGDKAPAA